MNIVTLHFKADNQQLTALDGLYKLASNTVEYIKAAFDLGANWSGFDSVRAIWYNDFVTISKVLDSHGECIVPHEVLARHSDVYVNLVGSNTEDDELVDRLTTYPLKAIEIDANARVEGSETVPITPSQFDQFAAAVHQDAVDAYEARTEAEGYAQDAKDEADKAAQYAAQAGYMFFYIDDDSESDTYGHLIMDHTENVQVQFSLEDGYLFVEG